MSREIKEKVFVVDANSKSSYLDDINYWIQKNIIKETDIISINVSSHMTEDYQGMAKTTLYWTRATVLYWG